MVGAGVGGEACLQMTQQHSVLRHTVLHCHLFNGGEWNSAGDVTAVSVG